MPSPFASGLGRGMDCDFSSVLANPTILMQLMEAGFKFQPSPEELISNYLEPKSRGDPVKGVPMAVVNLCKNEPWELPEKAMMKLADQVWYFFCPRDLKHKKGKLANRKTKAGYWKSTCNMKPIMAEHTKQKIGVIKTLTFYRKALPKAVRTEWMIHELDIITNSSLYEKGQYVLCVLEKKSEDDKTERGEQNHHMVSVSDYSEAEPSQGMASAYEDKNRSEMTVNSASDVSDQVSHHVASDRFENQNSNKLMVNSAHQVSALSHCKTSDFSNQNSNKLMSNSVYDGSGSSHSTGFISETQHLNQPTVDSASNGSKSHYNAFESETQISNNIITVPTDEDWLRAIEKLLMAPDSNQESAFQNEGERGPSAVMPSEFIENSTDWLSAIEKLLMAPDLKNQESEFQNEGGRGSSAVIPSEFIKHSTIDTEPTSTMAFGFKSQNVDKEADISAFVEGDGSYLTATPADFGKQNPCKKTDMSSTLGQEYPSYLNAIFVDNDLADEELPEVTELLAEMEGFFEQENSPNTALDQLPVCLEESHYYMGFDTSAST